MLFRKHASTEVSWPVQQLERREMLAADAGAAVVDASAAADDMVAGQFSTTQNSALLDADTVCQGHAIVFIDSGVDNIEMLSASVAENAEVILLDANQDGLHQITAALQHRTNVRSLHIVAHGSEGAIRLGNSDFDASAIAAERQSVRGWSAALSSDADILVYGCDTGRGSAGEQFVRVLAELTGADVAASTNKTGHARHRADWILERSVGTIESPIAFTSAAQNEFDGHLAVTIRAAGSTGDEQMQLLVDGSVVQTWNGIGGDPDSRQFVSFTHDLDGISADRIRVAFTNDLYDPANGIDRNLYVDKIVVDGVDYETEAPDVLATGVWQNGAVVPGFYETEALNSGGYFQYASSSGDTSISITAAGTTGEETMQLQIDGQTVRTWNNVGQANAAYVFNTSADVTADQIRVVFSNDVYDPDNGIDRNLVVDKISINGTDYETESPLVYSTGTWRPGIGVQPGFLESERLNVNGYFQYATETSGPGTIVILAAGSEGSEEMLLQIDGVTVRTFTGIGGDPDSRDFQLFTYQAGETVSADRIRVVFSNDLYDPANGIDRNLRVDKIVIDGVDYESEAPNVLATGVWRNGAVVPGFYETETLNSGGYFQYDAVVSAPGVIGLAVTQVTVSEDDGTVQIGLNRSGGSDGEARAYFQTVDIDATAGQDYVNVESGEVVFADGQTTAFATVNLINNNLLESVESFSVSLFRVEEAVLGVPRTATVTIVDDEAGEDLIGHWRLDESAIGQTVVDASGLGNDGTHIDFNAPDGPSTDTPDVDSPNPRSLFFGGDDYVSIGPSASLDLSDDGQFTQSVWVKADFQDDNFHAVLGYQEPGDNENRYPGIWVYQRDRIHAGFGTGTSWNSFVTPRALNVGEWNHVATTFDGSSYLVYVNGVEIFQTQALNGLTPAPTNRVDIGRIGNFFEGNIDDVRIYNRALSAAEIEVLLDGAIQPPTPGNGDFIATNLLSGFDTPVEVDWLPDGRMLVAEQDGYVRVVNTDGTVQSTPLLDITDIVNSGVTDRGMIGFAVHPDFENNPYIYASYTYDPPETAGLLGLDGPDGNGSRVSRISRFTVNAAGTFADPASNVVLVGNNSTWENISEPSTRPELGEPHSCTDENGDPVEDCIPIDETSHAIGELEFGPDGMLYAASGDGGSFGRVDPVNMRALDLDSLAGKILRVDPITGEGLTDNPFFDGDVNSNQSKVYNYGVRNPFRFAFNDDGEMFIGDVGWTQWEEINRGGGQNFGWPAFEGGAGDSLPTGGYQDLTVVQDYYATNPDVTAPMWARLHSEGGRAIVMGDFVSDSYDFHEGSLVFTDIGDQTIRKATFDASGNFTGVEAVSIGLDLFIVDIATGPDGFLYYVDIAGTVGRLDTYLEG